jgi:hypothetical protein
MSASAPALALPRRIPFSISRGVLAALLLVGGLVALQIWAVQLGYPLRVTSDTPTYIALLQDMAAHPFAAQSPFLATPGIQSPLATPYMLALAMVWKAVASPGHANDALALGRFLGYAGIVVSLATLGMIVLYARQVAGRRAAWLAVPVLLVMFGPAHVIWANDLSLNGLLYAGFYPQNPAIALALGTLLALRGSGRLTLLLAIVLMGATMVVHQLTGTLLAGLVAVDGCLLAARGRPGAYRSSAALVFGFLLGMAWPAFQLNQAMAQSGLPGSVIVAALAVSPRIVAALRPLPWRRTGVGWLGHRLAVAFTGRRALTTLSVGGMVIVAGLAVWTVILILSAPIDPLIHSNRLALYWGEGRWRWFLMFAAGASGLCGLVRLARRGEPLPLIWFGGCYGIALLGLAGLPVPVWWRFLLLGQIPLAIGTAIVLVEAKRSVPKRIVQGTLVFALLFKLATLIYLPSTITYFGSPLQEAYSFGQIIPAHPAGLVASDPFTSYYVPAATGHKTLTETKAHVGSEAELLAAAHGYDLLHALYTAPPTNWWPAAQALWNADVRWFLVDSRTLLSAPNLQAFSTGPTPLIRTTAEARAMGHMYWRLGRIGTLVFHDHEYALYRLDHAKLFPPVIKITRPAHPRPRSRARAHGQRRR